MIRYKIDVLKILKDKGFSTYKLRKDKLIGEQQIQNIRCGDLCSKSVLDIICRLLECQPGDILEYVPDIPDNDE